MPTENAAKAGAKKPPPPAVPAATILLVRDGAQGMEVFLVERHHQVDFAHGALVFPGGKVDAGDAAPELAARCRGAQNMDAAARALRVAAIRETFEEAGVLLARESGGGAELISGERCAQIASRHRAALNDGARSFTEIVQGENLELACDQLADFAHWITPLFMPKRFDTAFFLVAAPAGQLAAHDGGESTDSLWCTPQAALASAKAGRRTIVFPTRMNLQKLGRSKTCAAALSAARAKKVVTVFPRLEDRAGVKWMCIPAEAGYAISEAPLKDL